MSANVRDFTVGVRGFDFDAVYVRATCHSQARYICAAAFKDADMGTLLDGLRCITSVRACPPTGRRVVAPHGADGCGLLASEAP